MNAPLLPLKPMERLGWLRHFASLRCRRDFPGFGRGYDYPMVCETVRVTTAGRRPNRNGVRETVTLTGCDLMIILTAGNGWRHRFLAHPQGAHPIIHDFEFLVRHFAIPEVPDVAALNPVGFETYKARLRALEGF